MEELYHYLKRGFGRWVGGIIGLHVELESKDWMSII